MRRNIIIYLYNRTHLFLLIMQSYTRIKLQLKTLLINKDFNRKIIGIKILSNVVKVIYELGAQSQMIDI